MIEKTSGEGWLGRKLKRKEDHRLTTGRGEFIADFSLNGMLHLVFVRSVHAHAKITAIDTSEAEKMPGVVAVITGEQLAKEIKLMPQPIVVPNIPARYPTFGPLAIGKVKFHGEPVVAVVARDKYVAEDAAELVVIEYDQLSYVGNMEAALTPESPLVHDQYDDNAQYEATFTGGEELEGQAENDARVAEIFENADVVIKRRFRVHRCGVTPMEPRGAVATWDQSDGLKAWITTQRPHIDRLALSDILDIRAEKVRVIAPRDQGGGFGVKAPFYREPILICHMARKLGRPVRWLESREEHLMSVSQERDQIHDLEVAARSDGRVIAIRDRMLADGGDGCEGVYWGYLMPFLGAALLPSGYDVADCDIKLKVAFTNKAALSPARSFGSYPGRFAIDRAVHMVARELNMEPAEVHRMNLVTEFPHTTATGVNYDSGDFVKVMDNLVEQVGLADFRREQEEARKQGRYLGIGFGLGAEASGMASEVLVQMENQPGFGAATVRIDPKGKVQVFDGDATQGQGHETTVAQVVAHELGVSPDDVVHSQGDTASTPFGCGTIGARAGSYKLSAVAEACRFVKEKMGRIAAHDMAINAKPEDFDFVDGEVIYRKDTNIRTTFVDLSYRTIMTPLNLPEGETAGLEHTSYFEAAMPMICFAAHAAIVEVDPATGQLEIIRYVTSEDVGRVINPQIVDGQITGGVIQGISNCLFEEFVYDENGQQMTSTLENHKIATAADVPTIEVTHASTPCPYTPLGSRGIGEGIPGPVPGALSNAVSDALEPLGVEITELPLRPNAIWKLIQQSRQAAE
ncbi:MAG: xanthine dehydrogenase family protein molybdopterin-binding subunit [Rhodospirillales bacterium]|nr:xanthine dehydrogenase family protein molybdopterin-binding subunit [Rhodospirillales bacterium]